MQDLAAALTTGTEQALRAGNYEAARILLAIALRADGDAENARIREAFQHGSVQLAQPILRRVVRLWNTLASREQYEGSLARHAMRRFAFELETAPTESQIIENPLPPAPGDDATAGNINAPAAADGSALAAVRKEGPFPHWQMPKATDVDALLSSGLFTRDQERTSADAASGRSVLRPEAVGLSSCNLLAALVQLLLADPFSPAGFTPELFVAFLGCLRADAMDTNRSDMDTNRSDMDTNRSDDAPTAPEAPELLDWGAVASLDTSHVSLALREAGEDDCFYDETPEDAQQAWREARASRIIALLRRLREVHGRVTLDWLTPMETWAGLRALVALPGVSLAAAATLLLFELQRPLLPLCWNALQEAKALGWVPPQASATAAFLHLHERLPLDATLRRRLYRSLSQQHVFRLTRRAVVGDGEKGGVHDGMRQRRAMLTVHLNVRSRSLGGGVGAEEQAARDDEDPAGALEVVDGPHSVTPSTPALPLRNLITECMHWYKLFPEAGVTPALAVLHPLDSRAARNAAAAFAAGALPQQQKHKDDGYGLRYVVDVQWSTDELLACALLVSEPPDEDSGRLQRQLVQLQRGAHGAGYAGGGSLLFGFGSHLENGMHLAASANRPGALKILWEILWEHAKPTGAACLDVRGRSALHSAALAGSAAAAQELLRLRVDPRASDCDGVTPLAVAAAAGKAAVCQLLLDAAPDTVNLGDRQPLELAAASGALEAVRLLLARGAMINAQSSSGKTALHAAARAAQVETAHFLVDAGANVSLADRSERLAFEVVPDEKAAEFVWLAEISKASRKVQGKESRTLQKPRQPQLAVDLSDW